MKKNPTRKGNGPINASRPAQAASANLGATQQQSLWPVSSGRREPALPTTSTTLARRPSDTRQPPSSPWQFAACRTRELGLLLLQHPWSWADFPEQHRNRTRSLCTSWTPSCCCSHEGCSGRHWQRRKWRTALEGGECSCCAPVTPNSNGPDSQENCAWSSTEPQTCSETSRCCPPWPQDHRSGEGWEYKLGTYRKHHIC